MISFTVQKLFSLISFHLLIVAFAFSVIFKKIITKAYVKELSVCVFL